MHTVYQAQSLIDAHLVAHALKNEGILAFVAGEYLLGGVGQLPATDLILVQVPEADMARAQSVVRMVEAQLAQARRLAAEAWDGDAPLEWAL